MAEDFKRLAEKIARARQNAVDEIAENMRAKMEEDSPNDKRIDKDSLQPKE